MIEAKSASSSANVVSIRTWVFGSFARISLVASMPLPSGRRTSMMTTSGRAHTARSLAPLQVPGSPTTLTSGVSARSALMPLRTTSWSSTRTIRSGMVPTSRLFSQKAANPEYRRSYVRGDHRPCGWRRRSHSVKSIFIRYYVDLAHPRAALEQALLSAPANLIPGIATFADDRGQHLLAEVGFPVDGHRVSKNVQIDVGAPVASTNRHWIPIDWQIGRATC